MSRRFQIKNRRVNPFVRLHHGFDRKALLDPLAAGAAIDFRKAFQGPHRLVDIVDQETRLPVFDHLTAGAQVHGDHGHAGGIGFRQDQSESLRDGVQVQQRSGAARTIRSCPLRPPARCSEIVLIIEVRLDLLAEVGLDPG